MRLLGLLLRNDRLFFYLSALVLLVLIVTSRLFYAEYYGGYLKSTRSEIIGLLKAENFPHRRERHQVVLAAALNVRSRLLEEEAAQTGGDIDIEDRLHEAMRRIFLQASNPTGGDTMHLDHAYDLLAPGTEHGRQEWEQSVRNRILRYRSNVDNDPIVGCKKPIPTILEEHWGREGCDPINPAAHTSLLVSCLANLTRTPVLPDNRSADDKAANDSSSIRYSSRLWNANDISLVLEDALSLARRVLIEPDASSSRLVQAYFISPDGLLRYWNREETRAPSEFPESVSFGASTLIQEPLEYLARNGKDGTVTRPLDQLRQRLQEFLDISFKSPYIDYGKYGLVRTRTTPFFAEDGSLVGVFCTDLSLDLIPATAENSSTNHAPASAEGALFDWSIVDFKPGESGGCEISSSEGSSLANWPGGESLKDQICGAITQRGDSFFQKVQAINLDIADNVLFVVPLAREQGRHQLMLLLPQAPAPPWGTLVLMLLVLVAFLLLFFLRRAYENTSMVKEREATILRDLQAGVINVTDATDKTGAIEEGNDRAEEILGRRLIGFGVKHDLADRQSLSTILEEPVLYRNPRSNSAYIPMTLDDVWQRRALGLSFPFYAKLKKPIEHGHGPFAGVSGAWVRIKGNPVLGGERAQWKQRSIAVIHTISRRKADELEESFVKHLDTEGGPSDAS